MNAIEQLRDQWEAQDINPSQPASDLEIDNFQNTRNIHMPDDFGLFFKLINGTNGEYDEKFFEFYPINKIDNIISYYKHWVGIPDYKGIVLTLKEPEKYFVFANYLNHLYAYAIKLNELKNNDNGVFVVCGDKYKQVANTFTEFVELFLKESVKITI